MITEFLTVNNKSPPLAITWTSGYCNDHGILNR